jgi:hypothetical protein
MKSNEKYIISYGYGGECAEEVLIFEGCMCFECAQKRKEEVKRDPKYTNEVSLTLDMEKDLFGSDNDGY